jgi:hypothetical protein
MLVVLYHYKQWPFILQIPLTTAAIIISVQANYSAHYFVVVPQQSFQPQTTGIDPFILYYICVFVRQLPAPHLETLDHYLIKGEKESKLIKRKVLRILYIVKGIHYKKNFFLS